MTEETLDALKREEATRPAAEVAEQSRIESLIGQGYGREEATRIVYAKPAPRTGKRVEAAMRENERLANRVLSLLK